MNKAIIPAVVASALSFASAFAADLGPPPPVMVAPAQVEQTGWYLRGDIGVGALQATGMQYLPTPLNNPSNFAIDSFGMGDQIFLNAGVGYAVNNWLRLDVTAEYRTKAPFNAWGHYTWGCTAPIAWSCTDTYNGFMSSYVFLANAYIDLGTWCGLTPFIGGGIGAADDVVSGFTDVNVPTGGADIAATTNKWNFAWAAEAGLSYSVTPNVSLELAYRFLSLGSAAPANGFEYGPEYTYNYAIRNIQSQDVMLGFRWNFNASPGYASPQIPLATRG